MAEPAAVLRIALIAALALAAFVARPASAAHADHAAPADAPDKAAASRSGTPFAAGGAIFSRSCAGCHDGSSPRAPTRIVLQQMRPEHIRQTLTSGPMKMQGSALSEEQRTQVAEYLAGRIIGAEAAVASPRMCRKHRTRFDFSEPPAFTGWGLDPENTHALTSEQAGITRDNVGSLKLKWAFGLPESSRVRSQPSLAGGSLFIGTPTGQVLALDRETGCMRWSFDADAEVRTTILVSPWQPGDKSANPLAYFADAAGNAYAVEAASGRLVWKVAADRQPSARITGSPALHGRALFVPVSSQEESAAANPRYACCSFRGNIVALDAATGAQIWRSYLVEPAARTGTRENGTAMLSPSGVPVWSAPTVDAKRGQLYIATGNNYSAPASDKSNAIVALDLTTGAVRWHYQATAGDAFNAACVYPDMAELCPNEDAPDFDFGAAPVLAKDADGRELLLAGQKSGIAYALDPDSGTLVWQNRLGRGGVVGGIHFGIAAASGLLYAPVSDAIDNGDQDFPASPGLYAVDMATGELAWSAPSPDSCTGRKFCNNGLGGGVTATPQIVIAGSDDAHLRIYDAASGKVLWDYDTMRTFDTVNGVAARGGAITAGTAPLAWQGELFVGSGYDYALKMPGNVLLAFEVE